MKDNHHTEQRASDNYLILAAHILWELWVDPDAAARRGDSSGAAAEHDKYFWKAVVLLEYTLKLSPSNFNARFLLVKFYNQAGKSSVCLSVLSVCLCRSQKKARIVRAEKLYWTAIYCQSALCFQIV